MLAAKTPAMRANAKMRLLMLAAATSIDGVCNRKRGPRARGCMKSHLLRAPTDNVQTRSAQLLPLPPSGKHAGCRLSNILGIAVEPKSWPSAGTAREVQRRERHRTQAAGAETFWLLKVVRSGELLHRFSCRHALAGEVGPIPSRRAPVAERLAAGYATSRAQMEP